MALALAVSFFASADGADARLKNEWKFGGGLARLIGLPFGSALLGNALFDDDAASGVSAGDGAAAGITSGMAGGIVGSVTSGNVMLLPKAAQSTGGSLGGLFSRPGVVGGFSAGFLGAGVLGLVFGHGMTSELSGTASFLGLIFQITLILMLARLFWTWWRVDQTAGLADMSPRELADAYGRLRNESLPDIDGLAERGFAEANTTFDHKD